MIVGESVYAPSNKATGITYNAVAFTSIGGIDTGSGDPSHCSQWRLIAPATGANNVVVTFGGSVVAVCGAVSATAVHQTTMVGAQATANGISTTPSVSVVSISGELVADNMTTWEDGSGSPTVGSGQTERWNDITQADVDGMGSTEPATGSSTTMSWTLGGFDEWGICGVAFKTAAVGGRIMSSLVGDGGLAGRGGIAGPGGGLAG